MTRNGIATNVSAITTAVVVNGMVTPNVASSQLPTIPCRPSTRNSATPPTTGGSTSGTVTRARSSVRPRARERASTQASGTPRTSDTSVARVAETSDQPQRLRHSGRGQLRSQRRPRRPDQQPDQREDEEGDAERRRDEQRGRRPRASVGAHSGGRKPASVSTRCPASDSTSSTNAAAAAGLPASPRPAIG